MSFIFLYSLIIAQDNSKSDSLINVLNSDVQLKDSLKLELLYKIAFNLTDPNLRVLYADQLIDLAKNNNSFRHLYIGNYIKGSAYKRKGEFDNAIKFYLESLKIAEKTNDITKKGKSLSAIGDAYSNEGNHDNAIKSYNKAIKIFRENSDSINLSTTLLNTGYKHYLIGNYDSALAYYTESGEIFKNKNYKIGIAYNIGNSGLVYAKQKSYKKAELDIQNAIKILRKYDDSYSITEFQIEMASIYENDQNYSLALKYSHDAERIAKQDDLKNRIRDASLKLSDLYQATGNFEKAYYFQSQYITYRDSINNEETIREMANLQTEFEVGQKQAELELVEAQQKAERERSYIIGAAMVAVLILIGVIAYIQYKSSKQRKATNVQLAAQKQQLEQLNQTKDRFFSIISHDLRGPVNAFAGISKLIKMYLRKGKVEEINDMAEDIDESAGRLSSLLDNLLEWAVQQQGQFPYTPEKINFNKITKELIDTFETTASGKEIHLYSKINDDISLFIDKNSTTTIFRNLVGNALKFTPEGGEVFFDAKIQNDSVLLSVNDSGVGIPKEKFDKLFKLSENKSTWGTSGEKGLGLGLQLAYEFTEMNKGNIIVESTEGQGTSFIVELPLFEKTSQKKEATII